MDIVPYPVSVKGRLHPVRGELALLCWTVVLSLFVTFCFSSPLSFPVLPYLRVILGWKSCGIHERVAKEKWRRWRKRPFFALWQINIMTRACFHLLHVLAHMLSIFSSLRIHGIQTSLILRAARLSPWSLRHATWDTENLQVIRWGSGSK